MSVGTVVVEPTPIRRATLEPWRCSACARLLGKVSVTPGMILEIKCGSCKTMNTMVVT